MTVEPEPGSVPRPDDAHGPLTEEKERLGLEKLRRELADLQRPYLLRNPQLLIALITSVGAVIGVFLLLEENYFKVREERNNLQQDLTQHTKEEAERVVRDADQKTKQALASAEEATKRETQAIKKADEAAKHTEEAQARLTETAQKLESINRALKAVEIAEPLETAIAERKFALAREIAYRSWQQAHTSVARTAVLRAYKYPLIELRPPKSFLGLSPDGKKFFFMDGKTLVVWDVDANKELRRFGNFEEGVESPEFSPDSSLVVLRERKVGGGEPQIWDAVGLKLLREFPRTPIYFSPDSTKIVPYLGGSWLVYDTRSWGSPVSLQYGADQCPKPQSELKFRFSRKGDLILAWAPRSSVCVWDAQTGKLVNASPTTRWLYEVGFSKNDTYMTTNRTDEYGRRTNLVEVWTPGTVEAVYTHRSYAPSVSYDGTKVVSATVDKKAVIWDITTGKTLVELIGHQDAIRDVAFSSDDQRIITASDDQTARIWDARTGTQILELSEYGSPVTFASFVSQGRVAATIDLKRNVAVFRVVTPEEIEETLRLDFPARARNDGK